MTELIGLPVLKGKALPDYTTLTVVVDEKGNLIGTANIWKGGDSLYADLELTSDTFIDTPRVYATPIIKSLTGFKNGLIEKLILTDKKQ